MKNIIFLAPPAAGKGTISNFLKDNYSYQHISTGKILREKIKTEDEESKYFNHLIQQGQLIEDRIIFQILKEKLTTLRKNDYFILDGVPRTLSQAHFLDIILRDLGFSDYLVINIKVKKEILYHRFIGRRICPNCQKTYNIYFEKFKPRKDMTCDNCGNLLIQRIDDTKDSFSVRYEIFEKNNKELVAYYKEKQCLYEIDYNENGIDTLKELERIVGAFVDK